jgi:hypothetical protein
MGVHALKMVVQIRDHSPFCISSIDVDKSSFPVHPELGRPTDLFQLLNAWASLNEEPHETDTMSCLGQVTRGTLLITTHATCDFVGLAAVDLFSWISGRTIVHWNRLSPNIEFPMFIGKMIVPSISTTGELFTASTHNCLGRRSEANSTYFLDKHVPIQVQQQDRIHHRTIRIIYLQT